jgi:hypothetical protein
MRHPVLRSSAEIELRNESCRALIMEAGTAVYSFVALVEAMLDDSDSTDSANESGFGINVLNQLSCLMLFICFYFIPF